MTLKIISSFMLMELKNELYLICYEVVNVAFLPKVLPKCYPLYVIGEDVFVLAELVRRNK